MEKEQRNRLQKATQDARKLLEEEFRSQLLQTYDIDVEKVRWAEEPGAHLQAEQRLIRDKLIAWIDHKEAQINDRKEALLLALREMAFTALNRFVALKLMEARELVRPCVSGGLESAGFLEFTAVAQGLLVDQESSYRLYLETIFEDVSRELRALFDPRDPASLLWPKRGAVLELLDILNRPELAELWIEDETLGWVYQYFNGDAERKKMREESAAPRNSRELAVRNQFFTPRYVVEFLTDNTLGRIWYEMRQGNTGLKDRCHYLVRRPNEIWLQRGEEPPAQPETDEPLSQEELLRQPVHIPHRPLKDPREIRMLDPACGSMHFGLYSFDLYLEIYQEAWEIAKSSDDQVKQADAFAPFAAYAAGFAGKPAFLREVPKLILQYNIHGIDIDPRATQIARLTLWLRAQRAWKEQQLQVADRSVITRSNVVCAEPMPGERELLADFVDQQFPDAERGLVQQFLEAIFDKMQLAGEAGSLLKIEEEIRDAIDQARREWQKLAVQQRDLFSSAELKSLGQVASSLNADLQNLTKNFWIGVEERIYSSLRLYAEQNECGSEFQRRLFAEDASQGFAFIDICRNRYDVTLMNPPFGLFSSQSKAWAKDAYPENWKEIYAAFGELALDRLHEDGLLGAITPNMWLFTRESRSFRAEMLKHGSPCLFAEIGPSVMDDAAVEAALWVSARRPFAAPMLALDLTKVDRDLRYERLVTPASQWLARLPSQFEDIEGIPYCYYLSDSSLRLWKKAGRLDPGLATVAAGNTTFDDFRFLRLWWECPPLCKNWRPYRSGSDFQPFFASSVMRIKWHDSGSEARCFGTQKHGTDAQVMQSSIHWGVPGLAYPRVGARVGVRLSQPGEAFSSSSIFLNLKEEINPKALVSLLNSASIQLLLTAHGRYRKTETLAFKDLPIDAKLLRTMEHELAELSDQAIRPLLELESLDESSLLFSAPRKIIDWRDWEDFCIGITARVHEASREISSAVSEFFRDYDQCAEPDATEWKATGCSSDGAMRLASWLVGVIFTRWTIASRTKESPETPLFNPESPLPSLPPAFCNQLNQSGYASHVRDDLQCVNDHHRLGSYVNRKGFCVCEPKEDSDFSGNIQKVLVALFDARAEQEEMDLCSALGVKSLSEWFLSPSNFFSYHLKCYSKNRRQAPIYWHLSTGHGAFCIWMYYPLLSRDTLYLLIKDFIEPRIQRAEREQLEIESRGGFSSESSNRLLLNQSLLADLHDTKNELDLVAPLWNPNLNDGVIINHAILWRITSYTPWQKKCKECWDRLLKGDYDWAHLAFHLWPERVIPKCVTDRSLAIAHGLEERLWQETNNGNWLPRQLSEADLQTLIAEHSNPAVKSALERFLATPPPVAPTRARASRSTRSSGTSTPRRARGSAAVVDAEATRQVLLALTAAPSDGLAKTQIADLIGLEANALTAVIKQLKESGQIDQLGERRGARYLLSEKGRAAVAADAEGEA